MTIVEKIKKWKERKLKKKKRGRKKKRKKVKKEEEKDRQRKKEYHITAFPMSVQWCPVWKLFICSVKGHKYGLCLIMKALLPKIPHFNPSKDVWKVPKQLIKQTIAKSTLNAAYKNKWLYLTVFYFLFLIPLLSIDHVTWPTLFNELEGQCIQLPLSYYQDFNYPHTKIIGKCRRYYPAGYNEQYHFLLH